MQPCHNRDGRLDLQQQQTERDLHANFVFRRKKFHQLCVCLGQNLGNSNVLCGVEVKADSISPSVPDLIVISILAVLCL